MTGKKRFTAIIFDCDGVLVDSEPFSCGAWNVVFEKEYHIDIGSDYTEILGKNAEDTAIYYLKRFKLPYDDRTIARLCELKEKAYFMLAKGKLKPIDGVEVFIKKVLQKNIKLAVASSGTQEKIRFNLKEAGLLQYFSVIVGSDGAIRGKPFPDVFLTAAEKLKVPPANIVVIEDTPNGIIAAKRAGMFTIGITTTFSEKKLKEVRPAPDMVVTHFTEIPLATLF